MTLLCDLPTYPSECCHARYEPTQSVYEVLRIAQLLYSRQALYKELKTYAEIEQLYPYVAIYVCLFVVLG